MIVATWNLNSIKVRLAQLLDWLAQHQPDIVCLQEIKTTDENFPTQALAQAGYRSAVAGQKTYNGVAILTRQASTPEPTALQINIPGYEDPQRRLLAATVGDLRVVNTYFPNGQAVDSDKYTYKLSWIQALTKWLRSELAAHPKLLLAGDFNIAPEPQDVHDPQAWEGRILYSDPERAAFKALLSLGLLDSFRLFEQPERSYTWWDYRNLAFRKKMGLRIDHILLSAALAKECSACTIDIAPRKNEGPSDHAPVMASFMP